VARAQRAREALVALAALAVGSAVLVGSARRAVADEHRMRVGVVASVAINAKPADVQALVGAFQRDLEAAYLVEVVPQFAGAPPPTCASDTACLVDLTARLDVDRVVFLVLTGVGRKLRVDATVADAGRHVTYAPATIIELGGAELDRSVADYARALLVGVPPRPAPTIRSVVTAPPEGAPPGGVVGLGAVGPIDHGPRRHERAAWIAFGTAAVLLVGGMVAGHYASSAYDEYKTTMSPARYDVLRQRVSRDSTIANGLFIGGGCAAAAGGALYVIEF
jgi:hypothetical protein